MHYDRARSSFATDLLSLTALAEAAWAVMVSRGPKYGDGTESTASRQTRGASFDHLVGVQKERRLTSASVVCSEELCRAPMRSQQEHERFCWIGGHGTEP